MVFNVSFDFQAVANPNQISMLILQESCTDVTGSLVVHTTVNAEAINLVMTRGDSSSVVLLPSGFAIIPDCSPISGGPINYNVGNDDESSGSLLTIGFRFGCIASCCQANNRVN
ncbi:unnamed protein product [Fraxinus pennsylvanica]|uniref:HD-Zip IV C-terminal domain-containing protein n=1 Tax=Fraxinus pennsylvanica TaxID=56036 RepID=A0AAD1ZXM3_9LAMI|nr:unnamed protein product [Fraxinus pennsylvanica]